MSAYSKTYRIRFSDIDANRHVNNSVYIDAAGEVRYEFFAEHEFRQSDSNNSESVRVYKDYHAVSA